MINTYEYSSYSYPVLRSYITFDYSSLTNNLGYLRPFVGMLFINFKREYHSKLNHTFSSYLGYRGRYSLIQILNDPFYYQNAAFLSMSLSLLHEDFFVNVKLICLGQGQTRNFYVGGRFLTQCEVSFLQETTANILNPLNNLNDEMYVFHYILYQL